MVARAEGRADDKAEGIERPRSSAEEPGAQGRHRAKARRHPEVSWTDARRPPPPPSPAELEQLAENCEAGARRLAGSELPPDERDAEALAKAAALHRAAADQARPAAYWWQDRT